MKLPMPSGLLSDESEWFTATKVSVDQKWTTSNDELKVGDAITRTITINAQDSLCQCCLFQTCYPMILLPVIKPTLNQTA